MDITGETSGTTSALYGRVFHDGSCQRCVRAFERSGRSDGSILKLDEIVPRADSPVYP